MVLGVTPTVWGCLSTSHPSPPTQVVLNCPLGRGLRYSQATPQFHQWREGRRVWGLSFAAPPEAAQFAASVLRALQALDQGESGVSGGVPNRHVPPRTTSGCPLSPQERRCPGRTPMGQHRTSLSSRRGGRNPKFGREEPPHLGGHWEC